jgi:predicted RNA polymerase sigma factor
MSERSTEQIRELLDSLYCVDSGRILATLNLRRRLRRIPEARASYEKALALARQEPERRFLAKRLEELK